jgi:hypothetical protein
MKTLVNSGVGSFDGETKKEEAYLVKVDALFNLGREEELTTILEEVISINPRTSYKPLLNFLRLDRGKANY